MKIWTEERRKLLFRCCCSINTAFSRIHHHTRYPENLERNWLFLMERQMERGIGSEQKNQEKLSIGLKKTERVPFHVHLSMFTLFHFALLFFPERVLPSSPRTLTVPFGVSGDDWLQTHGPLSIHFCSFLLFSSSEVFFSQKLESNCSSSSSSKSFEWFTRFISVSSLVLIPYFSALNARDRLICWMSSTADKTRTQSSLLTH